MALAETPNHSCGVEPCGPKAPRGQKTSSAAGKRPAPLEEVAEPQEAAGMVGYMPASVPLLGGHRLQGHDGVDGRTVRFLLKQSLALQEKEKEREEEEEEGAEASQDFFLHSTSTTASGMFLTGFPGGVQVALCSFYRRQAQDAHARAHLASSSHLSGA